MPLPSVLDELDRLFDELIRKPWGRAVRQLVPVELHAVEDGWVIELPVEGLAAADLKVEVHGRHLTVTGHRRRQRERHGPAGWSQTEQQVAFERRITLPADADPDSVEAKLEGTALSIHVRKRWS